MPQVGVRELKNRATQIVRDVRETGAEYVITLDGEPVAVLRPCEKLGAERAAAVEQFLIRSREIAERIGAAWTSPLSAAEAVEEQRRTL